MSENIYNHVIIVRNCAHLTHIGVKYVLYWLYDAWALLFQNSCFFSIHGFFARTYSRYMFNSINKTSINVAVNQLILVI